MGKRWKKINLPPLRFQLDKRVGEKRPIVKIQKPKANPLEKMLKLPDDEEISDYDKLRMRNIQERIELYKQVKFNLLGLGHDE